MNDSISFSPALALKVVMRRKRLFILAILICVVTAGVMAWRMHFTYESTAQVLIKPGVRQAFSVEAATLRGTPIVERDHYYEIANTLMILRSRAVLDRLIRRIEKMDPTFFEAGPKPSEKPVTAKKDDDGILGKMKTGIKRLVRPPSNPAAYNTPEARRDFQRAQLRRAIGIEQVPGTTIVNISAQWGDSKRAYLVCDAMLAVCQEYYREFFEQANGITFLEQMVQETEGKLERITKEENDIHTEFKVSDAKAEITALLTQLGKLQNQHTECRVLSESAAGRTGYFDDALKSVPEMLSSETNQQINPEWQSLYQHLQALELRKLGAVSLAGSPDTLTEKIEKTRQKLQEIPKVIDTRGRSMPNPLFTNLKQQKLIIEAEAAGARQKCSAISSEISELRLRIDELQRVSKRLDALKLQRKLAEDELKTHLRSVQTARHAELLDKRRFSSLQVIEFPERSYEPLRNRRPRVLAGGLFAGILLGLALCFFLYIQSREVASADQLRQATDLKVLGSIPSCKGRGLFARPNQAHEWN